MKKMIATSLMFCFVISSFASIQTGSKKSAKSKSHHSGTYKGGKGSSHKGGHDKNASTNNSLQKTKIVIS
jgi:hypothetical protein